MHHLLSKVTMDDTAVFYDSVINTLGFTTQRKIDEITNFVESFGEFIYVNDGDIETFFKDNHYANNDRAAA